MNEQLFTKLKTELTTTLKDRYGIEGAALEHLVEKGQSTLKTSLMSHISKNGTQEAEDIICSKVDHRQTALRKLALESLDKGIKGSPELGVHTSMEVAETAVDTLFESMRKAFAESGKSRDTNGVSEFIGIDPMLLKMVNSPVGKIFGKFMK